MKRFLAMLLTIAIMISSVVIVSAEDTVLTLNTAKKVSITVDTETFDNSVVYTFTPTETAWYWFTSSGQSEYADPFAQVYTDSDCNYESQIASGEDTTDSEYYDMNFNFSAYLTANKTYYVKACAYVYGGVSADVLEYNLMVTKAAAPTGIEIDTPTNKYGYVGNSEFLTYSVTPSNAMTSVLWTTSNSSIATVDETGFVQFHKKGNVTITATGAGFTDSIVFEVKDAESIEINGGDIIGYAGEPFYFTYSLSPDKVNTTVDWSFGDESFFNVEYYSSDIGMGFCSGTYAPDKTGNTTITVTTENGITDTVNVTIKELVDPTAVTVDSSLSVELGSYFSVDYTLTPSNSKTSTTWTSSNPSVVDSSAIYPTDTYSGGTVYMKAIGAGTTTITVKTENGKTDTITVTVVEPECTEITTAKDETITFEKSSDVFFFKFIPTSSGLYVFETLNDEVNSYATLYNGQMEQLKEDDNSGIGFGFKLGLELTKGETYYLKVESINSTGSISITARTASYPSSISVFTSILDDVRVGEQIVLQYTLLPSSSFADITWESDNINIGNVLPNGTLIAVGEGTFNLTVRGTYYLPSTGLTELVDTVEVTVKAPDATLLNLDESVNVTTVEEETELFKFVPETTGNYVLYSNDETGLGAEAVLRDSSMMNLQEKCMKRTDGNFALGTTLYAGETYYFEVSSKIAGTFAITLVEAKEIESITILNGSNIKAQVENRFELQYEFSPIGAYESLTWTSSDEDVAFVAGGYVEFWSEGKVDVTAKTASGKQATVNIDVIGNIDISVGESVDIEVIPSDGFSTNTSWTFEFTVPSDGAYCIRTENSSEFLASLSMLSTDDDYNREDITTSSYAIDWKAGDIYAIGIHNAGGDKISDTFRIDLLGDIDNNGAVTSKDVTYVKRHMAGGVNFEINEFAADVSADGVLSPKDITFISRAMSQGWNISFSEMHNGK